MKLNILIVILCAAFLFSCGKKDNATEQTQQVPPVTQQPTQQQVQQDLPKDTAKKEDITKKEADKKKEEDKKKEDEKKKKEEEKKKEETKTAENKQASDIDFAPIFAKRCAKCHGKDAKGKDDGGPDLTRSETQNKSDNKLHDIISNGVKADNEEDEDMPSFKGKLTEEEIDAAVKWIKGL
ncbi:MAG: cytochrome c [Ignavibacteriae bacterium]|nr:MAG: cytochrome c [Ignavibacteriota bacterium]